MTNAGIVLCGGQSSRMGRAKAWLPWGEATLFEHVVSTLAEAVDEVFAVTAHDRDLPKTVAKTVFDATPDQGPLAGISAGLAGSDCEFAYVTATDTPFLTPSFVKRLLAHEQCVAPRVAGIVQTLAAVYPQCAATLAQELLAAGRRRPLELLEAMDSVILPEEEIDELGAIESVNTPDEYLAAVRRRDPNAVAVVEFYGRLRLSADAREVAVAIGTLGEILAPLETGLTLVANGQLAPEFRVSIDGKFFSKDLSIPVGPGEHVILLDASAGG